ncbi:glycine cleavage system protein GcvH [Ruania halotolerans]|uniref:glycine cleavage system protein GcvH n=1 Tax=Ruania halotolerans TaxID=2897773 RepID=UPI001E5C2AD8|nr:glycine cleavage system protein GcvH [Ruania halotolerans]UFU06797.1 glycine cleavage system protein GcvH [Ruania halotolerans]
MTDVNALQYTAEHEWIATEADVVTIGITDYAADQLGDVVFVDLPAVGTEVKAGETMGEIESTKSVSELYAPVTGEVVEVNEAVDADPALVNSSPFEQAWLVKVRVTGEVTGLLDRAAYEALTGAGS